jgi:hypothetical protein
MAVEHRSRDANARGWSPDTSDGTKAAAKPTRAGRHRPRVRPYHKRGLTTLRRTVEAVGGRLLDGRTTLARQLAAWRADLVHERGVRGQQADQVCGSGEDSLPRLHSSEVLAKRVAGMSGVETTAGAWLGTSDGCNGTPKVSRSGRRRPRRAPALLARASQADRSRPVAAWPERKRDGDGSDSRHRGAKQFATGRLFFYPPRAQLPDFFSGPPET